MSEDAPDYGQPKSQRPAKGGSRKSFLVRLSPELHDELRRWADQELRSLNAHIEYLLRDAVRRRKGR